MGKVLEFRPKALVEFEEMALEAVTGLAVYALTLPSAIRQAKREGDRSASERAEKHIAIMTAIDAAVADLERAAEKVQPKVAERLAREGGTATIQIESPGHEWRVIMDVTTRSSIIFINQFRLEPLKLITGPNNGKPFLLLTGTEDPKIIS